MTLSKTITTLLVLSLFMAAVQTSFAATLTLPGNVRVVGEEAFANDGSLDEVALPDGIEVIESRAFADSSVKAVKLPDSLYYIADDAFDGTQSVYYAAKGEYSRRWLADNHKALSFSNDANYDFDATMGIFEPNGEAGIYCDWFVAYYELADFDDYRQRLSGEPVWSVTQTAGPQTHTEIWPVNDGREAGFNIEPPSQPCKCDYEVKCVWDGLEVRSIVHARYVNMNVIPETLDIADDIYLRADQDNAFTVGFAPVDISLGYNDRVWMDDYSGDADYWNEMCELHIVPHDGGDFEGTVSLWTSNFCISKRVNFHVSGYSDDAVTDIELRRAIELGLGTDSEMARPVRFSEFAGMLNGVLGLAGKQCRSQWNAFSDSASRSSKTMTRREGMVATYLAAESMGPDYYSYNNLTQGIEIFNEIASVDSWAFWNDMNAGDYSLFDDVYTQTLNGEGSYVNAGYFYSMRRASMSGRTVFDYDSENKTMRPADAFTYGEGLLAAVRLYDSYVDERPRELTETDRDILRNADERRSEILNSATDVAVSGTCYYVANNGNDSNDGRSPSRPWATLDKVNNSALRSGDGVFFRRGDTWRGALLTRDGVTYSAYGSGAKPGIFGSPENGAGAGKWTLLNGTSNIWVFHTEVMECADIVANGSMDVFDKASVWWNGSFHVSHTDADNYSTMMAKSKFDPAKDLKNHEFFSDVDWSGLGTQYPLYVFTSVDRKGTLYLRCDEGNPGQLYSSIEFCCDPYHGSLISAFNINGVVLDNLCAMYCSHAMEFYGGSGVVQNCEVGYIGAMTHTFYLDQPNYSGDGINHGDHMLVQNNYVHDAFNSGIAPGELSFDPEPGYQNRVEIQGDNIIRHNLLERTSGIVLINWETEVNPNHMYKDVVIEDNYVLYSVAAGDPTAAKSIPVTGALIFSGNNYPLPCANEGLVVKDNVFYCARGSLIISGMPQEYLPTYSGNIYAQYAGVPFAYWLFDDGTFGCFYDNAYTDAEDFVRNVMGDATGVVLR